VPKVCRPGIALSNEANNQRNAAMPVLQQLLLPVKVNRYNGFGSKFEFLKITGYAIKISPFLQHSNL